MDEVSTPQLFSFICWDELTTASKGHLLHTQKSPAWRQPVGLLGGLGSAIDFYLPMHLLGIFWPFLAFSRVFDGGRGSSNAYSAKRR